MSTNIKYRERLGSERYVDRAAAYISGDASGGKPSRRLKKLIRESEQKKLDLVLGYDEAYSHHIG